MKSKCLMIFASLSVLIILIPQAFAQNSASKISDVEYFSDSTDSYAKERCKLDIYLPQQKPATNSLSSSKGLPVLVWFHGGGITSGDKSHFPKEFLNGSYIFVSANYRLSPKITADKAIEDAAKAVAWTFQNIEKYGGDKSRIFIGGHSAGGYLSGMVGFSKKYLAKYNIDNKSIAGMFLVSAQVTKHFQVRKDLGDKDSQYIPKIDELAILGNLSEKVSPVYLILGDRRLEFPERVEENELLYASLRTLKISNCKFYELQGFDHSSVVNASPHLFLNFL